MRKFFFAAALVGAAILGTATPAHAAIQVYAQEAGVNGGNVTQIGTIGADFTSASFSGTYGDFTLTIFGAASHNGVTLSDLLSASVTVANNDLSGGHTLILYASQNNYTLPAGSPLRVESGMSGTVNSGTISGTGVFQAYADKNNNLLATGTPTGGAAITDFTNGPQTAIPTGSTFDTGSAVGTFARTGMYSVTSRATFVVSAGGSGNFSSHVNLTAVPAPAGVVLALAGLPCLGIGAWVRRRKVK